MVAMAEVKAVVVTEAETAVVVAGGGLEEVAMV